MDENLLKVIKETDWVPMVRRRESLVWRSIVDPSHLRFAETTGINWMPKRYLHLGSGMIFFGKEDDTAMTEMFTLETIPKYKDKMVKTVKELDDFAHEIEKLNTQKLSKEELREWLERFFDTAERAMTFLSATARGLQGALTKMLQERLPAPNEEHMRILSFPSKKNNHVAEAQSFLNLVKNPSPEAIAAHVKEYAWIGARGWHLSLAWTEESIRERIAVFTADPDEELAKLAAAHNDADEKATRLLDKLKADEEFRQIVALAREFAYLRTWRTDIMYRAGYLARGLLLEPLRRLGKEELYPLITFPELFDAIEGKLPSQEELDAHAIFTGIVIADDRVEFLFGKEWKEALSYLDETEACSELRGQTGFGGKVQGIVKVINDGGELGKVQENDILVASMTFPNYVPAMEKAAAFVTDEGGILCHAAIVAREMQKPCVIGTKIATKVFKDGDEVLVNADNGIVRKL